MATEVTCIVDTDGTQSPDYTSLAAAIAGETGVSPVAVTDYDLVTNDEQLTIECRATSGAADTTELTIPTFVTDADCYVKIYVPPAHRHNGKWSDSKSRLINTATRPHLLTVQISDLVLEGVLLGYSHDAQDSSYSLINVEVACNLMVKKCILKGNVGSNRIATGIFITGTSDGSVVTIENSIICGTNRAEHYANANLREYYSGGTTINIYNCVSCDSNLGIDRRNATVTVRNCAVFNNVNDFNNDMTVTYTASDDNDVLGTGNVDISPSATEADDWAAAFTDYTNGDFSLKSGSDLIDAGIGPGQDSNVPTTDIVGNTRSGNTCCIGAFEYVSIPVAMHHYNLLRSA